jgi:hypothetical protein
VPRLSCQGKGGTGHADGDGNPGAKLVSRRVSVQTGKTMTLICPKCQGGTELRGTMDAYYLTWCRECARLWRIELWTLVHADEPHRKMPWVTER